LTPEQHAEIERICHEALALPAGERAAYLAGASADAEVRRQVESLLEAATAAEELFREVAPADPMVGPGTAGPYEIQEKLGEGGMGVVYRARQRTPVVRDVALKVIRPGMASPQLVARFQLERQALALMEHPNIARVLDAGATSLGLPYMAIELVDGRPIAQFCADRQLTIRERVALMIPVCQAVQHAHQKGIIHRDIKPSNVLVTVYDGQPTPKLIDFGIAKGIESALGEMEARTRPGVLIGTFDYMSPEQAEPGAADVDTRTDIYSLGALLYQLVTGKTPLEGLSLERSSYPELLRRIREEMPPAVSSRLESPDAPELDWIVAKALEKDRERRYASADGMAQDLRRFLDGEPVDAGPPSFWYRARKFATRHRWAFGAAAAVAAALVVAVALLSIALRQERRANASTQALREVVRKIIVERPAQLARIPNRTALHAELMRDAEGALEVLSGDTAPTDVALRTELAQAYLAIGKAKGPSASGDPAAAEGYVRKAVELYRGLARELPDEPEIRRGELDALSTWMGLKYRLHQMVDSEKMAHEIEDMVERLSPALRQKLPVKLYLSTAWVELGVIRFEAGHADEGLALHRKASGMLAGPLPPEVMGDAGMLERVGTAQRELALSMWTGQGSCAEALEAARRAVELMARCDSPNCRLRWAIAQGTLGGIEWAVGKRAEGIATMRQSIAAFARLAEDDPANAQYRHAGAIVRGDLAMALAKHDAGAEAVAMAEQLLASPPGADAKLFKGRERRMVYGISLGGALVFSKRFAAATQRLRDVLDGNRDWSPNVDLRWSAMHLLILSLEAEGEFEEALRIAREAWHLIDPEKDNSYSAGVRKAIAAADYARTLARRPAAWAAERDVALRALQTRTRGLPSRCPTFTGALLEAPPTEAEVARLQQGLAPSR
jgi:eukaryotic-like serine/threonine-protein kinase